MDAIDALSIVTLLFGAVIVVVFYRLLKQGRIKLQQAPWALAVIAAVISLPLTIYPIITAPSGKVLDYINIYGISAIKFVIISFISGVVIVYLANRRK